MNNETSTREYVVNAIHKARMELQIVQKIKDMLCESDEEFVRKLLDGTTEEEKDIYFSEFPEYAQYRCPQM